MKENHNATTYPAATMTPDTVPHDPNQAYALVHKLVYAQVHRFYNRFGGDFSDLESLAGEAFVRGHAQFVTGTTNTGKPIKGSFAYKIRQWVWYSLFDAMRNRIAKNDATEAIGERDFVDNRVDTFDLEHFTDGLGTDATAIVKLLIDPPRAIMAPAERRGGTPRNYRSSLREYLIDRGWDTARVTEAFLEIKNTLK